jgi:hypothetical protein
MFLVLWEFEVKPGCETCFERVYRPGGDWDSLFCARSPPHRKSLVPRYWVTARLPHCRLCLSRKSYEEFLQAQDTEYKPFAP